jgi:hypothetical protein
MLLDKRDWNRMQSGAVKNLCELGCGWDSLLVSSPGDRREMGAAAP